MDHEIGLFLSQVNCPEKLNICAPGKVPLPLLGLDGNRLGVKILLPGDSSEEHARRSSTRLGSGEHARKLDSLFFKRVWRMIQLALWREAQLQK